MDRTLLTRSYSEHIAHLSRGYARALEATGYDAVVIHAGSPKLRSAFDDQYWPLRATPHFQHWLPLMAADSLLVVASGQKPKLLWLQEQNFWETAPANDEDFWHAAFDIVVVRTPSALREHLPRKRVAFVGEEHGRAVELGFDAPDITPPALLAALDELRTQKTSYEELCLAEANRRAAVGHTALAQAFHSGDASEFELHLLYLRATGQDDPETPYKNIVALGANAATLHHVTYRRHERQNPAAQSLLVDAGASCYGYCSDITRTHVKGSSAAASSFASLRSAVERLQQTLCREVRVGERYEALHDRAHEHVAAALREVGIVKISAAEAVANGTTRAFFPHGLGHSLGLQCHDVGCAQVRPRADNPFLRNTSTIAERQCFTIEPGIYFIDSLLEPLRQGPQAAGIDWPLVAALSQLGGIRVEDDLVVGGHTTRNLTREHLPA